VFIIAAVVSLAAAVSAKFLLAPMRKRWINKPPIDAAVADAAFAPSWSDRSA
jgi:OFA family oxalate/formate antiporter-like MFS transporter